MYFPFFIDISEKHLLIAGGGTVAARRLRALLPFAGPVTVVAPEISEEMRRLADSEQVTLKERPFAETDLSGQDIALAATDDEALNREIAGLCRERGIPVNVSSDRTLCDFQFPSLVIDEGVVIGINASGTDHGKVKETRKKVEGILHTESLYDGKQEKL